MPMPVPLYLLALCAATPNVICMPAPALKESCSAEIADMSCEAPDTATCEDAADTESLIQARIQSRDLRSKRASSQEELGGLINCNQSLIRVCPLDVMFRSACAHLTPKVEQVANCDALTFMWTKTVTFRVPGSGSLAAECDAPSADDCPLVSMAKSACNFCDAAATLGDFPDGLPHFRPPIVMDSARYGVEVICDSAPRHLKPVSSEIAVVDITRGWPECKLSGGPPDKHGRCYFPELFDTLCMDLGTMAVPRLEVKCRSVTFSWTQNASAVLLPGHRLDGSVAKSKRVCPEHEMTVAMCEYCDIALTPNDITPKPKQTSAGLIYSGWEATPSWPAPSKACSNGAKVEMFCGGQWKP